ncbi:MAG: hypothetical protein ABSG56_21440 [Bryobacteraceae bacterium]
MPLKTYDESTAVLRRPLDAAKLGGSEKLESFARLDRFVRAVERRYSPEADFEAIVAHEHAISPSPPQRLRWTQGESRTRGRRATAALRGRLTPRDPKAQPQPAALRYQ